MAYPVRHPVLHQDHHQHLEANISSDQTAQLNVHHTMTNTNQHSLDQKSTLDASVEHKAVSDEHASDQIQAANANEHNLTFRDVARKHPKIIWWSFFWCMCAVGCEFSFPLLKPP